MTSHQSMDRKVASAFFGNFQDLRNIQKIVQRPLLAGENVVLTAGTGSGKTEAIVAPIVGRLWRSAVQQEKVKILYIAPTKALVNDIEKRLFKPLNALGMRIGVRHGDRDDLTRAHPPHILVTTPESLEVLMFRHDNNLYSIEAIILDEVHLLYNTQRGFQLSILINRLQKHLSHPVQWAAISATIGSLNDIKNFFFGENSVANYFNQSTERPIDAKILRITENKDFVGLISRLMAGQRRKIVMFADSRRECEMLAAQINSSKLNQLPIYTHYSSLSADVRLETEKQFSESTSAICIATSTLELGIDIGDIDAVILWGPPQGQEAFLQRIGRGNRRGNKTNVVCLIPNSSEQPSLDMLIFCVLIENACRGIVPVRSPYEIYGAAVQQCLSFIGSNREAYVKVSDLMEIFNDKPYISRTLVDEILANLEAKDFVKKHGYKNRFGASDKLYNLIDYRMIYGNFGIGTQMISVKHETKVIGEIPAINLFRVRPGKIVRFAGKNWRIKRSSREGIIVELNTSDSTNLEFLYPGKSVEYDFFLLFGIIDIIWPSEKSSGFSYLSSSLKTNLISIQNKCQRISSVPCIISTKLSDGMYKYMTFSGSLINRAISLYTRQDFADVSPLYIKTSRPIEWEQLPTESEAYDSLFVQMVETSFEQSIFQQELPSDLQIREFIQFWLHDKTIDNILKRLSCMEVVGMDEESFEDLLLL